MTACFGITGASGVGSCGNDRACLRGGDRAWISLRACGLVSTFCGEITFSPFHDGDDACEPFLSGFGPRSVLFLLRGQLHCYSCLPS